MKSRIRCEACGRRRKLGHELRVGTELAYSAECKVYVRVKGKSWQSSDKPTGSGFFQTQKSRSK